MPKQIRVSGHELVSEGRIYRNQLRVWVGPGHCTCGAQSPQETTDAARQRWHREHKIEVLATRQILAALESEEGKS